LHASKCKLPLTSNSLRILPEKTSLLMVYGDEVLLAQHLNELTIERKIRARIDRLAIVGQHCY
jgi:hypothetical protein